MATKDELVASNDTRSARKSNSHLSTIQGHLVAASGEFVGTFFFLWLSYATNIMAIRQAPSPAAAGGPSSLTTVIIAMGYSFALLVNVWAFFRISGGLFNPAVRSPSLAPPSPPGLFLLDCFGLRLFADGFAPQVTLGLSVAGQLPWLRAAFLFPAQLLACMCAGGLVQAMFPGDVSQANSILSRDTSIVQGLFIEMFFTAQLVFVVLMLAMEKSKDTFLAPVCIGLALFAAMIPGEFNLFRAPRGDAVLGGKKKKKKNRAERPSHG